jgi:LysM repeat protein
MDGAMLRRSLVIAIALTLLVEADAVAAVHTVEKGDTLWDLSKQTGCTIDQLKEANAGTERLRIGDRLEIPACGKGLEESGGSGRPAAFHVVQKGDTLAKIGKKYGASVADLRKLNKVEQGQWIIVGQKLRVPGQAEPAPPVIRVVKGQSVGAPGRGRLVRGVQLPEDGAYYRRHPKKSYGAQHVIDHTRAAIRAVKHAHPSVHRLAIGDISGQRGGPIQGHRSHQSGRDIDIGLYFKRTPKGYPEEFVLASSAGLDEAATWTLIEALARSHGRPGGPEYIFLDYKVQGRLYKHALQHGATKSKLEKIFQYPKGPSERDGLVRHEPNHADHIHVRFSCPAKDLKCK